MSSDRVPEKLSVIVPVYNTASRLGRCIESVLRQNLDNFELIMVDDGSTDGSWDVMKNFERKIPQLQAIRQEHRRQGAARNRGIESASGEFISFLDSDDFLPDGAYRGMLDKIKQYDTDMVAGILASVAGRRLVTRLPVYKYEFSRFVPRTTIRSMPRLIGDMSACNRIIRRRLLDRHAIRFPERSDGEDIDFMARVYLACDSITVVPQIVYCYKGREGSVTRRNSPQFFEERVEVISRLEQCFDGKRMESVYKELVCSESRKLVGERFTKFIRNEPYDSQVAVFEMLSRLATRVSFEEIYDYVHYDARDRFRMSFLKAREFEAMLAVEKQSEGIRFAMLLAAGNKVPELVSTALEYLEERRRIYPFGHRTRLARSLSRGARTLRRAVDFARNSHPWAIAKYFLAAPVAILRRRQHGHTLWLMDERISQGAQDNGFALFDYLVTEVPTVDAYFVISSQSPKYVEISLRKNVVRCFSWKHALLLRQADVLLSTDSFRNLAYPYEVFPGLRRDTVNVFLQHGVAGNKKMTYARSEYGYFTRVIVSNEREKRSFEGRYGFGGDQVVITGLARFDKLPIAKPNPRSGIVLVAPTWRRWLRWESQIRESEYFWRWSTFLRSARLDNILDRHGATLAFVPHHGTERFFAAEAFSSTRIAMGPDVNARLDDLIRQADILITDYSSIMYDFFYQLKPVLSYMFDRRQWETQSPGSPEIDFDIDVPLEIHYDQQGLHESIDRHLGRCPAGMRGNENRLNEIFRYRDNENRKRIVSMVIQAIGENGTVR